MFGFPHEVSMTNKEIEMAMEALFRGAEKIRTYKHSSGELSMDVRRKFIPKNNDQIWSDEKNNFRTA
tara:strand:- start:15 stop:215 length:201 start_codon:yes stop_codon:yes gene_type:complete